MKLIEIHNRDLKNNTTITHEIAMFAETQTPITKLAIPYDKKK